MKRRMVVKGMGKVSTAPDLIVISFTLDVVEAEYEKTMDVSTRLLDALRTAITNAGFDGKDLKTASFSIDTHYESFRDAKGDLRQRFDGYLCSHRLTLEFALDMERLATALSAIADCETYPDFKIRFTVKDSDAVSEQLLENAVSDATTKAETLARAANLKLGAIQEINYSWGELHLYSDTNVRMEASAPSARSGVSPIMMAPDDIDVSGSVTIVWAIE